MASFGVTGVDPMCSATRELLIGKMLPFCLLETSTD
jgi:hypothetical protein